MNIRELFKNELFKKELFSYKKAGGDFPLQDLDYITEDLKANSTAIKESSLEFSNELKENLIKIYDQVYRLSIKWLLSEEVPNETLDSIEWLKNYRIEEEVSFTYIREQICGTLNIVSLDEMFDQEKYSYLTVNGIRYLPFDDSFGIIACFKQENNVIEDNLYLFHTEAPEKIRDMGIGCMKYLELAYSAKLFYYWQYAYLFKDSAHNERLNTMLPIIFPHIELDLSDFQ